jgi:hypothetical protein
LRNTRVLLLRGLMLAFASGWLTSIASAERSVVSSFVQPVMSQVTTFVPAIYSSTPGLLAVGSPALSNPVNFYEGSNLIASAASALKLAYTEPQIHEL